MLAACRVYAHIWRMMIRALLLCLVLVTGLAGANAAANDGGDVRTIVWADLLPEGESDRLARLQQMQAVEMGFEHFGVEQMPQIMKIGTTRRGIGPAYEDKVGRRAVRVIDLADETGLRARISDLLHHHNALRRGYGEEEYQADALVASLLEIAPKILPFAAPVWRLLDDAIADGQKVLFEGAQGAFLDVDHGTYPFVTSSNTVAGQAAAGTGVGPGKTGYVLGIVKAYTTRVGEGPFPTELTDETGRLIGEKGHEFGTVTSRQRRCGWFDAVLVRQSAKINGLNGIALTKLDVLDGFETLQVCTGYELDGKTLDRLPASTADQARVTPVYEEMEGWSGSTRGARSWADLPAEAVKYVRRIEELIEAPVAMLSTSPEREDVILMQDPFRV